MSEPLGGTQEDAGSRRVGGDGRVLVQTTGLAMDYPLGKRVVQALRGVDLEVQEGEFVALMGTSGCGKSTLLHILGGLLTPTRGRVWVAGAELTRLSDAARTDLRRRTIGFVFQRFNLFPTLTVQGNLQLAERIYSGKRGLDGGEARRREVLCLLGLDDKLHHRPTELSGGEQQRVALARAVIHRPALVLADEPTGNLDSESSATVLEMLKGVNEAFRQTVVMITHNPEAAAFATRAIRMKDGRIVA
jgi:putative ABC transport system ATP-binding protein